MAEQSGDGGMSKKEGQVVNDAEQYENASKTINMRGWVRITLGSTRLSNLRLMRRKFERLFKKWPDSKPCMWEIVVRVPPSAKKAVKK